MKLSEAIPAFLSARQAEGIRPNTLANYRKDLNKLLALVGDIPEIKGAWRSGSVVGGLNASHMDLAFSKLHEAGYAPGTINIFQSSIRAFCKWLRSRGHLMPEQDPLAGRRWLRDAPKPRRRLSVAQTRQLLELDLHPRDHMLIAVGIFLLLRQSEAASLRISDVDLDANRIRVTIHKSRDVDLMVIPVELRPILRKWLAYYADECGPLNPNWYLIPAKTGARFGVEPRLNPTRPMSRVADIVNRALDRIGFPTKDENGHSTREGMHTLRRSSALNLYHEEVGRGVDQALMTAKSWLHHKSVTMTERYLGMESGRESRNRDFEDKPMFPSLAAEGKIVRLEERRAVQ